ncbi:MAG: DUF424 family protein [Candidatus Aenigmarchaeota archaeon]|nr:DUF424 family protein [Candidatus Aenigmarchaeota archaeon]
MKYSFKLTEHENEKVLGIADRNILGKTFSDAGLEITISKDFYHQDYCTAEKALELIKSATIINAFGRGIIELMVNNKIIPENAVLKPCKVPHAQVFEAIS